MSYLFLLIAITISIYLKFSIANYNHDNDGNNNIVMEVLNDGKIIQEKMYLYNLFYL